MKNLTLKIITFTVVLGIIALAINYVFGAETFIYLRRYTVHYFNGTPVNMYKIDFWSYVKNIQTSATNASVLELKLPTREWNNDIPNDLALLMDFVILIINILLYPIKIGAYLLQNILAILGINNDTENTRNGLAWLIIFIRDILGRVSIPYI